jgi:hypothetical protein
MRLAQTSRITHDRASEIQSRLTGTQWCFSWAALEFIVRPRLVRVATRSRVRGDYGVRSTAAR